MTHLKQVEQAVVFYQHSLDEHGPYWTTFRNMGKCWELLGNPIQALDFYRKSLELKQNNHVKRSVDRLEFNVEIN